jgi:hypothetical protein
VCVRVCVRLPVATFSSGPTTCIHVYSLPARRSPCSRHGWSDNGDPINGIMCCLSCQSRSSSSNGLRKPIHEIGKASSDLGNKHLFYSRVQIT